MRRDDLNVLATPTAVRVLVLDADIRKVDLIIEVGQVVFIGPVADLIGRPIGVAVVVVVVLVAFVQPLLVLALELVVEGDPLDVGATLHQTRLCLLIRAIDLKVLFHFPLAFEARVEGLVVLLVGVPMPLKLNRTGLVGGSIPREDGPNGTTQ